MPVILNGEFEAQISVRDKETVILGGLITNEKRTSRSKIPLLGDIPLMGRLFSSQSDEDVQTELIVLLTPYVLTSDEEMRKETRRRYQSTDMQEEDWPQKGWSESSLQSSDEEEVDLSSTERAQTPKEYERLNALLQDR